MTIAQSFILILAVFLPHYCVTCFTTHPSSVIGPTSILLSRRSSNPLTTIAMSDTQETPQRSPLEANTVWKHVNHVLEEVNPSLTEKLGISLRPITDWKESFKGDNQSLDAPLYFGIELVNTGNEKKKDQISFLSFYIGYSTWEGLCVFVDELGQMDNNSQNDYDAINKDQLFLPNLGQDCGPTRFQTSDLETTSSSSNLVQSNPVGPPSILEELHIFHMDQEAMKVYVNHDSSEPSLSSTVPSLDRSSVEVQSKTILESSSFASHNKFSMRLANANNLQDAQAMHRLVEGLAIYVKEPLEDIHCDASDYLVDGSGSHPLYYTFLLETEENDTKPGSEPAKLACGNAIVYFGHSHKGGRYLYLEDLYVDQAYQHQGAGSLALKALTTLALKMNCQSFQWLALDWNQPALDLYQNKMGAKIQEGKKVTRYTDRKLKEFADGFSKTLAEM
eukprot:CAMPEP_0113614054 /NCGR_PEP_ID=MMETSP0017_2-20120614/6963_1 /TAXON_ID=2856 /ORGANISM="Cylindrotheca closterium" /LENGTH=447 /DNA_ID=CAMNT_0000523199 /DNA_START=50 /DNA_END=1394 /DNA_ORIENTATION=+ /assembly_acc=CAM_ASM_000147